MKIQESVETCITKQYADFIGTATRSEFWWFILFLFVVEALLGAVRQPAITAIFALATLVPYFAVGTRRLRDTGRSPWWWLIGLIPVVGAIVLIVFWVQQGETPTTPT